MVDAAGDFLHDDIEVDVVHVEAGGLVHKASPNLVQIDWLPSAVSLYNILNNGFLITSVRS